MPFAGSSDVLPWNHNDNDPAIDGSQVDIQTVQVLRINTTKFTSDELATIDSLPQAVTILDDNTPTVIDPILIDVKTVAAAAYIGNGVCTQFDSGAGVTVTNLRVYLHD